MVSRCEFQDYNVRKMEIGDVVAIQKMIFDLNISSTKREDGFLVNRPTLRQISAADQAYVVYRDGIVLGFTLFYSLSIFERVFGEKLASRYPKFELDSSAWFGFLIGVRDVNIKLGIGSSLVEKIATEARKAGVNSLYAEVVEGNPALIHHLHTGWILTGAKRDYLGRHRVHLIEMKLSKEVMN